jgi:hypothetical protein
VTFDVFTTIQIHVEALYVMATSSAVVGYLRLVSEDHATSIFRVKMEAAWSLS